MIVVQTPLRISFFGGGTDFEGFYRTHGGAVLSTAIDKYVYVVLKERFDEAIYVNYSKKEIVSDINELQHELVREAMKLTGVTSGVEITTLADVPSEGTGLGSSSSITIALLQALYAYRNELVTAEKLAREACQIEIEILSKPIGRQDQYIAAYGNMQFITFNSSGVEPSSVILTPKDKRRLNENLLLFFTGRTRSSASILTKQKENIEQRLDTLCQMRDMAVKARDAIMRKSFDEFGELLHQAWELKKSLADNISNAEIDQLYLKARQAGAIGGKIAGAGGGGFLLLYCPKEKNDRVREALGDLRELPFAFEPNGSRVIFDYRRAS